MSYIKEQGANGKVSMRQVVETIELDTPEYICINFGKMKYQKKPEFVNAIEQMNKKDRSYVMDMKWPLADVYHVKDEQIERILGILSCE